jgi:hypothetical protein
LGRKYEKDFPRYPLNPKMSQGEFLELQKISKKFIKDEDERGDAILEGSKLTSRWADAEKILGFKIKDTDAYDYLMLNKIHQRRVMFPEETYGEINEAYVYINKAISSTKEFIVDHFKNKFGKKMSYDSTYFDRMEELKQEMLTLKVPPPQS